MSTTILIDTMVASAIFSFLESRDAAKARVWMTACRQLASDVDNHLFAIPTPVFFEYASWNELAYRAIETLRKDDKRNPMFQYIDHSITADVLLAAARYRMKCSGKKIALGDSLIAAYCLHYGYRLITVNEKDFPRKYFSSDAVVNCPGQDDDYADRRVMHLLSPKISAWNT